MRRRVWIAALSSLALSACGSAGGGCPPLVAYSKAQQARAAAELRALPKELQLSIMIVDYGKARDACRLSSS